MPIGRTTGKNGLRVAPIILMALTGCASTQLTWNSLEVAGTIGDVYTQQALDNLAKYIDDPYALPSQVDFTSGIVQTSNSIQPTLTLPLSTNIARTISGSSTMAAAASTTSGFQKVTTLAGASLGLSASDAWQQNWTITPVIDGNDLRNLRAVYRYETVPGVNLNLEYSPPWESNGTSTSRATGATVPFGLGIIRLTYHDTTSSDPADRPVNEPTEKIKVTPEMVEAGTAVMHYDSRFEDAEDAAERVFRAMLPIWLREMQG